MSRSRHPALALLGAAGLLDEPPARRGVLRAFLETRGVVGGHARPHVHVRLPATDGTPLVGTWLPGPSGDAPAIVLAHGFAAHRRKPAYARLADALTTRAHVLAVDLRGHGHSGGRTTLGDLEALDIAGAVSWLHARGHDRVVLVGASMGATSVLHALARGSPAAAAVVVSAPAELEEEPATEAMQRLKRHWESRWSRAGLRFGLGVRVVAPLRWRHPGHSRDFAAAVDVPLLVVHGQDDAYFPVRDAEVLAAAAPIASLWIEPSGFGHAEDGFTADVADRLGVAIVAALRHGAFPPRDALVGGP